MVKFSARLALIITLVEGYGSVKRGTNASNETNKSYTDYTDSNTIFFLFSMKMPRKKIKSFLLFHFTCMPLMKMSTQLETWCCVPVKICELHETFGIEKRNYVRQKEN